MNGILPTLLATKLAELSLLRSKAITLLVSETGIKPLPLQRVLRESVASKSTIKIGLNRVLPTLLTAKLSLLWSIPITLLVSETGIKPLPLKRVLRESVASEPTRGIIVLGLIAACWVYIVSKSIWRLVWPWIRITEYFLLIKARGLEYCVFGALKNRLTC